MTAQVWAQVAAFALTSARVEKVILNLICQSLFLPFFTSFSSNYLLKFEHLISGKLEKSAQKNFSLLQPSTASRTSSKSKKRLKNRIKITRKIIQQQKQQHQQEFKRMRLPLYWHLVSLLMTEIITGRKWSSFSSCGNNNNSSKPAHCEAHWSAMLRRFVLKNRQWNRPSQFAEATSCQPFCAAVYKQTARIAAYSLNSPFHLMLWNLI